jgi:hypothetical protein
MSDRYTMKDPAAGSSYPEPSQGVLVLVLGIVSVTFFPFVAPVAWSLGNRELAGIENGRRPPHNRTIALIGKILGVVVTLLLILLVVLIALLIVVPLVLRS